MGKIGITEKGDGAYNIFNYSRYLGDHGGFRIYWDEKIISYTKTTRANMALLYILFESAIFGAYIGNLLWIYILKK